MKHTITLHLYEGTDSWNNGTKQVLQHDFRDQADMMDSRVWVGCQEITIDWPEIDTTQLQIAQLESQVIRERADSQVKINGLLERISKLKCLEHKQ